MSKPFVWQDLFVQSEDTTEYELLSAQHVTVTELEGEEVIKVSPEEGIDPAGPAGIL